MPICVITLVKLPSAHPAVLTQYVSITWFQMLLAVCTAVVMALSALPTICAVALVTSPSAWSWS